MSIMSGDRPVYCLATFGPHFGNTWEECCYRALLHHCFFSRDWEKNITEVLESISNNSSRESHWKLRSIIFQERNPICDVRLV